MIEIRKIINSHLKALHPNVVVNGISKSRVHFQKAPDDTPLPYIVFDLPNSFTSEDLENFVLDVDIWDNNTDTTQLETLAAQIWKSLHKLRIINNKAQLSVYRSNRLTLTDDDPRIRRRKLTFQVKYFDRG